MSSLHRSSSGRSFRNSKDKPLDASIADTQSPDDSNPDVRRNKNRTSDSAFSTISTTTLASVTSQLSLSHSNWSFSDARSEFEPVPRSRTSSAHSLTLSHRQSQLSDRRGSDTSTAHTFTTSRSSNAGSFATVQDDVSDAQSDMLEELELIRKRVHKDSIIKPQTPRIQISTSGNPVQSSPTPRKAKFNPSTTFSLNALNRWSKIIGPVSATDLWPHVTSPARTPAEAKLYWTILHRRLEVNHYLKPKTGIEKSCFRCNDPDETIEHALFLCPFSIHFWNLFSNLLGLMLGVQLQTTLRDVIYFFPDIRSKFSEHQIHVLSVMHSVGLWALWGARVYKDDTNIAWTFFCSRLQARICLEYQHITASSPIVTLARSSTVKRVSSGISGITADGGRQILPGLKRSASSATKRDEIEELMDGLKIDDRKVEEFIARWCTNPNVIALRDGGLDFPFIQN